MPAYAVPYLVGVPIHRSHQYWPTIQLAEIPSLVPAPDPGLYDEIWEVEIAFAQLEALSWRVKKWILSGSIEVDMTYVHGTDTFVRHGEALIADTDIHALKYDAGTNTYKKATNENDLVYKSFTFGFKMSAFKVLGNEGLGGPDDDLPLSEWEVTGTDSFFSGPPSPITPRSGTRAVNIKIGSQFPYLYNTVTKLFTPTMTGFSAAPIVGSIGSLIPAVAFGNDFFVSVGFDRTPVSVNATTAPALLKDPVDMTIKPFIAADFVVPMQMAWRLFGVTPGATETGAGTGSFTLQAAEFWPYSNSLGEPIFDVTTGAATGNDPLA